MPHQLNGAGTYDDITHDVDIDLPILDNVDPNVTYPWSFIKDHQATVQAKLFCSLKCQCMELVS